MTNNPRVLDVDGIKVFIANPRAIDQETLAMAQAMYSRTHKSIGERLPELFESDTQEVTVKEAKIKEALASFYLNYGHKSIGDCGNVTIFFEGVSQLFAKAVEDDQLFRGQETSTRYIDYSQQRLTRGISEVVDMGNKWLDFYAKWMPIVLEGVKLNNPYQQPAELEGKEIGDVKSLKVWENTCKARAFDIMRGYLPAGSTTNVAWTGSLRVVAEKLDELLGHPLAEVSDVAYALQEKLSELMPSSFEAAMVPMPENVHAYSSAETVEVGHRLHFSGLATTAEKTSLHQFLAIRKRGQALPRIYDGLAHCEISGYLDFGSFRDVQRHRALNIPMPMLRPGELHSWYVEQVEINLAKVQSWYAEQVDINLTKGEQFIAFRAELANLQEQLHAMADMVDEADLQYAVPLATLVPTFAAGPLSKMIYMLEMRSGKTVHATLRKFSISFADSINEEFGSEIIKCDLSEVDALHLVRGKQTFAKDL